MIFSTPFSQALGGAGTRPALIIVSITLLIAPYMAVYRGFFQGYEDMVPTAVSQVLEQFIRVAVILSLAVILVQQAYSHSAVAGGIMVGSPLGALVSLLYLELKYHRHPIKAFKQSYSWKTFRALAFKILKVSLPISIGSITMALFNVVDSLTIPFSLRVGGMNEQHIHYLFGIYSRGLTLVQIATVFPSSIILPLIPLLTRLKVNGKTEDLRTVIEKSHKMTHVLSWPIGVGLFVLAGALNVALFENAQGTLILAIIHLSSIFTSLCILGTGILQGVNKATQGALIIICGVVIKALLNLLGVKWFGLTGAAFATLIVYMVLFIVNTMAIRRVAPFKVINAPIIKMIMASLIMGAVIWLTTAILNLRAHDRLFNFLFCIILIGAGAVIYFIILWLSKALDKNDLRALPGFHRFFKPKHR